MSRCFFIAEAGVNHDGDLAQAVLLAAEAKSCGADAVKFQTYIPKNILRDGDPDKAELERLALPLEAFVDIAKHCKEIGIEFMSTPECPETLNFLVEKCGIKRIKIGSGDITNGALLEAAGKTKLHVCLSTGMSDLGDIHSALTYLERCPVTVLHCVSLYPCPPREANLLAIKTLRNEFSGLINGVGYSDHTIGSLACMMARTLGANVIEKHFTLDRGKVGADHHMSEDRWGLRQTIAQIRHVEELLGDGMKVPSPAESANTPRFRKGPDGKRGFI